MSTQYSHSPLPQSECHYITWTAAVVYIMVKDVNSILACHCQVEKIPVVKVRDPNWTAELSKFYLSF